MLNKILTFATLLTALLRVAAAHAQGWSVDPARYNHSMVVVGVLNLDRVESRATTDTVYAFVNGECRGVATPQYQQKVDRYLAYLIVYSNESGGEISYRIVSNGDTLSVVQTQRFEVNGLVGHATRPYVWSNVALNDKAILESLTAPTQQGSTQFHEGTVTLKVDYSTDRSQLAPQFTLASGATAWVGGVRQVSGVTQNDYTQPVRYTIRSEDEQHFAEYEVVINQGNAFPTAIQLSHQAVEENRPGGTWVADLTAADLNHTTHQFSLVAGLGDQDNAAFTIHENQLLTADVFDFEQQAAYAIRLQAQDPEGDTVTQAFVIQVQDRNETPYLADTTLGVYENAAPGTIVGQLVPTDPDANTTFTFRILGANTAFSVDTAGHLRVAQPVDFETQPQYRFALEVRDNGTPSLADTAWVNVQVYELNEKPHLADTTLVTNENVPDGTLVGQLIATDPDAGTQFRFALLDEAVPFQVDTTGQLWVAGPLDFEQQATYRFRVEVKDDNLPPLSDTAWVEVRVQNLNDKPVMADTTLVISENLAPAAEIATLIATDQDSGTVLRFRLIRQEVPFQVDSTGRLVVAAKLDYETQSSYRFEVEVRDNGAPQRADTAWVDIQLQDQNEAPFLADTLLLVNEATAPGTLVGQLLATDPDRPTQLRFALLDPTLPFLVEETGQLRVAESLDYETRSSYRFLVEVQDDGTPMLADTAWVDVQVVDQNDVPHLADTTLVVAENALQGTRVGQLVATDPDSGSVFRFTLLTSQLPFRVDTSGLVVVAQSYALDFETRASYRMQVEVRDNRIPQLADTAWVDVQLQDLNEAPVLEEAAFTVDENAAQGVVVGQLIATDADAGTQFSFSILTEEMPFVVDASGQVQVGEGDALNYEVKSFYRFEVEVRDNGALPLADTAWVEVTVQDQQEADLPVNNYVTPNQDHYNDVWEIQNLDLYEGYTLRIFDRYGTLVYETSQYQNQWVGQNQHGKALAPGVYLYRFLAPAGTGISYQGTIHLVR
ncbi:gliding motility-associated C-terminal domain-containing protein [Catalinimonas alkaloidigena]|uniref:Gliding motility-associated C-terminal domain-containing protein n=1 Tax=Catalinimonas alkaloidigena TaxID=1075417 RepID=A0A1G8XII0_9BACT|nr:cadherin domain-containing protein [Catalinimonas alkaloidigena]SDJ89570.1 gliding motility-associated C-terminal domain-containing protein [Catalinimonas alkaloidigena]